MQLQSTYQKTVPIIEAKRVIETLPQDSSYDDIIRELIFDKMIKNGLQDSKKITI